MASSPAGSPRFPTADELESQPSAVKIVATRVDGDSEDPAYVLTCTTPRDDLWPILRRFSRFKELRDELLKDDNPALKALAFPEQKLLGGSIGDALGEAGSKIFGGESASASASIVVRAHPPPSGTEERPNAFALAKSRFRETSNVSRDVERFERRSALGAPRRRLPRWGSTLRPARSWSAKCASCASG